MIGITVTMNIEIRAGAKYLYAFLLFRFFIIPDPYFPESIREMASFS